MGLKTIAKHLKAHINKSYGKKCRNYDSDCITCEVWRTHEKINALGVSEDFNAKEHCKDGKCNTRKQILQEIFTLIKQLL